MAGRGAARRQRPVGVVGQVRVLAPVGSSPYYRLAWVEPDGRQGRTSGGRTRAGAEAKAGLIDADLTASAEARGALTPLVDMVAAYTATGVGRNGRRRTKDWGPTRHEQITRYLRRCLRGAPATTTAAQIDRSLIIAMQSQGGTPRIVKENTTALRGLLHWGVANGYLTADQGGLLPLGAAHPDPAWPGTPAPARGQTPTRLGQAVDFIGPDDAPDAAQITALGEQLAVPFPRWGRLAPEVASSCGLRWGEQFQLTADDVLDDGDGLILAINWQISATAKASQDRRIRPKGGVVRTTPVREPSYTGYPLVQALKTRRLEARAERLAGTNQDALMFPAARGGMLWHTAFNTDYLIPAMRRAGWPLTEWAQTATKPNKQDVLVTTTRQRIQAELTWHSLRHRFARYHIDQLELSMGELMSIGGWTDQATVQRRYYRTGEEHWQSARQKIRAYGGT